VTAAAAEGVAEERETARKQLALQLSALTEQNGVLGAKVAALEQVAGDASALKEEMRERVAAAERRVYAITKERDALRKETERKGDSAMLLREKDAIIKEVMEEGEKLSKKQAEMEGMVRKSRAGVKDLEAERDRLKIRVEEEEGKVKAAAREAAAAEEDFKAAVDRTARELEEQKAYYTEQLTKARSQAAAAETAANGEARGHLEGELADVAAREEALTDQVDGLRAAMTRAAEAASRREERAAEDAREMARRCQESEVNPLPRP
jgi:chromosome segregation ATPase